MKKILSLLLAALLLLSLLAACGKAPEDPPPSCRVYDDGRARPSSCGRLRVLNGMICS